MNCTVFLLGDRLVQPATAGRFSRLRYKKKAKKQDMSQLRLDVELTKRQTGKYLKHRRAVASSVVCP